MTQNLHEWMVWQIHFYCCCWGQNICQKCFEKESIKRLSRFSSLFLSSSWLFMNEWFGKKKSKSFKSLSLLFLGSKKVSGMLHRRRMSSCESSKRLSRSQSAKRYRKKSIKGLVLTVPPIYGWAGQSDLLVINLKQTWIRPASSEHILRAQRIAGPAIFWNLKSEGVPVACTLNLTNNFLWSLHN